MKKRCVYHYCNINAFYSIICNRTLRLSDITKSNDQLEITWAIDIIRSVFKEQYSKLADNIKNVMEETKYNNLIDEKITLYFEQGELRDKFFVMCFSGEDSGDLLSQWRGYGDNGKGIAVGFSENMLKKIKDPVQTYEKQNSYILYNKVIYDSNKQKERMEEIIVHYLQELNYMVNTLDIYNNLEAVLLKCFPRLYQEAIFMKNPFFKEENESRLIFSIEKADGELKRNNVTVSKRKFYIRNDQLVSCHEIYFDIIKNQMIAELVLGPKCELDNSTLFDFLQENEFDIEKLTIRSSKGSYR